MKRPHNILGISIGILVILLIIAIISYFTVDSEKMKDFTLNLSTEIIGILLTIFLIDSVLRRNEQKEKLKQQSNALHQIRFPLVRHLHLMFDIYKSSIISQPKDVKSDYSDILLSDNYYDSIRFFDFNTLAPVSPNALWYVFLKYQVDEFKLSIEKTLEKYSFTLDSNIVAILESLINSHFYSLVNMSFSVYKSGSGFKDSRLFLESDTKFIKEYNQNLIQLLEYYNKLVNDDKKIIFDIGLWRNDISPNYGQSRNEKNNFA